MPITASKKGTEYLQGAGCCAATADTGQVGATEEHTVKGNSSESEWERQNASKKQDTMLPRPYDTTEEDKMCHYFAQHVQEGKTASIEECQQFLAEYCTPKQIQDKVRQLKSKQYEGDSSKVSESCQSELPRQNASKKQNTVLP